MVGSRNTVWHDAETFGLTIKCKMVTSAMPDIEAVSVHVWSVLRKDRMVTECKKKLFQREMRGFYNLYILFGCVANI